MINRIAIPNIIKDIKKDNTPVLFLDTCAILDIIRALARKSPDELCSAKNFIDRKKHGDIICSIILPSVVFQEYNDNFDITCALYRFLNG